MRYEGGRLPTVFSADFIAVSLSSRHKASPSPPVWCAREGKCENLPLHRSSPSFPRVSGGRQAVTAIVSQFRHILRPSPTILHLLDNLVNEIMQLWAVTGM